MGWATEGAIIFHFSREAKKLFCALFSREVCYMPNFQLLWCECCGMNNHYYTFAGMAVHCAASLYRGMCIWLPL